jgi:hypothetical protein
VRTGLFLYSRHEVGEAVHDAAHELLPRLHELGVKSFWDTKKSELEDASGQLLISAHKEDQAF